MAELAETARPELASAAPPEQGQLVQVRNRLWVVNDTVPHEALSGEQITRVDLECLDDDRLGEELSLIWEREVGTKVFQADAFPIPSGKWDHPDTYRAFLRAIRWSSTSAIQDTALQAPFRGAIEIEPYQLEPVTLAVLMPRVNLLIADDVGLGKTIEAGLVVQELLARARIRNCLILCPASLQRQWQDEMAEKFNLEFRIIDRDTILQLRREYGSHVNPWRSFPRLITSIDFLKQERILSQFRATVDGGGGKGAGSWDLLVLDEAHNCAPAGRRKYIRDSDRSKMLRQVAPHFQHRLFLTATPHNGFTESFTALLEELDPLRFHRGPDLDPVAVNAVMVRRLKEHLAEADETHRPFPKRIVDKLDVPEVAEERAVSQLLDEYISAQMERSARSGTRFVVQFALNLLKKRFLSSPRAFHESLNTHIEHVTRPVADAKVPEPESEPDEGLVLELIRRTREDIASDDQRAALEQEAMKESTRFFGRLRPEDLEKLNRLWTWAEERAHAPDEKFNVLRRWIEEHLRTGEAWNDERLIIFTEYRDTLEYLKELLGPWMGEERILTLTGGSNLGDRERVKAAFRAPPAEHPVRLLLATDAAAEGLNLQTHCRYLIHHEVPWNPNRLSQRNGRIDRHGQPAKEVFCLHFVHENRWDSIFLQTVVDKVEQMRADLGAVSAVIEAGVEQRMLGDSSVRVAEVSPREAYRKDMGKALWDNNRLRQLAREVDRSRAEWELGPSEMRSVLHAALRLEGHEGLEEVHGDLAGSGALLRVPPPAWGQHAARSVKNAKGQVLTLVFDAEVARGRNDVSLVHLSHPLMQRALGSFRRNMFARGLALDDRLSRVTYELAPPGLDELALMADIRLLAVGALGQKLHEEQHTLAFSVGDDTLTPLSPGFLRLLTEGAPFPSIPAPLGARLQALVRRHEPYLKERLHAVTEAKRNGVLTALADRAAAQAKEVEALIRQRRDEINQRLRNIRQQIRSLDPEQLRLDLGPDWDREEIEQFRQDVRLLEQRRESLAEDLKTEPERIRRRFELRHLRSFPLGLRFLIPARMVEGADR